jgi:hypothetical protein
MKSNHHAGHRVLRMKRARRWQEVLNECSTGLTGLLSDGLVTVGGENVLINAPEITEGVAAVVSQRDAPPQL